MRRGVLLSCLLAVAVSVPAIGVLILDTPDDGAGGIATLTDAARTGMNDGTASRSAGGDTDTTDYGNVDVAAYRPSVEDIDELTAKPEVRTLYESMVACFPPERADDVSDLFNQATCYEDIVEKAAAWIEPNDLYDAVNALVALRPDLFAACHTGGHKAAVVLTDRIWDPSASYEEQLAQFDRLVGSVNDVCQNGFVHGFYDQIGYAKPGLTSFKAAAEICNRITLPFIDCGHGLGHSAWISTRDASKAATLCGLFTDEKRYRCDDGVIMYVGDLWREEGMDIFPSDPGWDPEAYYARIPSVCDTWPIARRDDPTPMRGCWIGVVSGLIFRPISTLIIEADNDYFAVAEEMRSLAKLAEQACIGLGPEGESECMFEWRSNVMFAAANDEDAIRDFCGALVKHAAYCTDLALKQLLEERGVVTESSRNGSQVDDGE